MTKFAISVWSKSDDRKSKPLGKSYRLKNGDLVKDDVGAYPKEVRVVDIESFDDVERIIDFDLHHGAGFITSGTPKNPDITDAEVTVKDSPKKGCLSRSTEDIEWRSGTGTYFVIDYDSHWSNDEPKTVDEIHQNLIRALEYAGVDISELQMLSYESSSSGFIRTSDHHSFDKGGRHLIFLVEDAGDLERFKEALFVFMTLTGSSYGAVSNAGHFLKRGVMDRAAVLPTQPTFAGIPAYQNKGLINVREDSFAHRLGNGMPALDTTTVRDPTESERVEDEGFWEQERGRLKREIERKRRAWFEERGQELKQHIPDASPEQIRAILEHRWSGNLVGSDVITLGGNQVTVSTILTTPDKYDGATGPDPVEPEYRDGAQTCKVFMNRSNGRPMIYSQAHGGVRFRLWYDAKSVVTYLGSMDPEKAQAAMKNVLHATRVNDETSVESLLKELAPLLKTTKKTLKKEYGGVLSKNMRVASSMNPHRDDVSLANPAQVNDLAHLAAQKLVSNEMCIQTDNSEVWRFTGKCFEPTSDVYLGSLLRKIVQAQGWADNSGLTRTIREAITALKELTYTSASIIDDKPRRVLNLQNGELHFLDNGNFDLRKHDPSSRQTHVLPIHYDPMAEAPVFRNTLEQLFWPPAHERMKSRSKKDGRRYKKEYLENARIMRDYVEELMAYLLIPDRWIPAWFLWIGPGHNGKTFLTKIFALLLDPRTLESDRLQSFCNDNFGMERVSGKTLLIDDDLETNTMIPDGFVKKISESKILSANRKNRSSISFTNRCALLLLANNYPRMTDVSAGTTRRLHSMVFPRRFYSLEEIQAMDDGEIKEYATYDLADPGLIDKIEGELPGVINVLARAYQRLIERGGFSLPDAIKESNKRLLIESNPLPMFVAEQCVKGSRYRLRTSEFAHRLRLWISGEHIRWNPSNHQIRDMMRHLNFDTATIDGYEHYVGIKFKTNAYTDEMRSVDDDTRTEDDIEDSDENDWDI